MKNILYRLSTYILAIALIVFLEIGVYSMVNRVYRTIAGTKFYGREREVRELLKLIENGCYTILWGPRNVGKSELARYVSWLLSKKGWFINHIDIRSYLSEKKISVYGGVDRDSFLETISSLLGLPEGLLRIFDYGVRFVKEKRCHGLLWVVDEPHLLPSPRVFLEALIKKTLYTFHEKTVSVVITVSDGWFVLSDTIDSLLGYGAIPLFIDWLDPGSYRMFIEEIQIVYNKEIDIDSTLLYNEYTGGVPGALVSLIRDGLNRWIDSTYRQFINGIKRIHKRTNYSLIEILEAIEKLPQRINTLTIDRETELIDELVRENIAFYNIMEKQPLVKPQLPIYKKHAVNTIKELKTKK